MNEQPHQPDCDCQVCTGAIRKPGGRPPRVPTKPAPPARRDDHEHPTGCRCPKCIFFAFGGRP